MSWSDAASCTRGCINSAFRKRRKHRGADIPVCQMKTRQTRMSAPLSCRASFESDGDLDRPRDGRHVLPIPIAVLLVNVAHPLTQRHWRNGRPPSAPLRAIDDFEKLARLRVRAAVMPRLANPREVNDPWVGGEPLVQLGVECPVCAVPPGPQVAVLVPPRIERLPLLGK